MPAQYKELMHNRIKRNSRNHADALLQLIGGLQTLQKIEARGLNLDDFGLDFAFKTRTGDSYYIRLLRDDLNANHVLVYRQEPYTTRLRAVGSRSNLSDKELQAYFKEVVGL